MKKKIVSVLLVAAMAVSMFTGCGSKSDSKKSDDTKKNSDSDDNGDNNN